MRYKLTLATAVMGSLLAADTWAGPPENDGKKGRPAFGDRNRERDGAGQRDRGNRPGRPGKGRPDMNPEQFVARLMQQFDNDGDQKLNAKELTAMLTAMRERRGNGGPGAMGRPGAGKDSARRRRPNLDNPGNAGGDQPKRPPVE